MIVPLKLRSLINKLNLATRDLFKNQSTLIKEQVAQNSSHNLSLNDQKSKVADLYQSAKYAVSEIDHTLEQHVEALQAKTLKTINTLEKKMLKAEIKRFEIQQRQISTLRESLFPKGELQERVENFMPYYAKWGSDFLDMIYNNSLSLEQKFSIIETGEEVK